MKRELAFLLSLCFLFSLCACGKQPGKPTEPTSEPISETEPTKPEPAVFSLKHLPEIGSFVSDEKKAYFFEDGPHEDFEPRDDYGPVVPYIAETVPFREVPYYTYEDENNETYTEKVEHRTLTYLSRYGIMTRDGRIITGPLFDYCWYYTDQRGVSVWSLSIEDPEDTYLSQTVVLAEDGSWRLDFDKDLFVLFEYDKPYGYMWINRYDENAALPPVELYTFDGEPVPNLRAIEKELSTDGLEAGLFSMDETGFLFMLAPPQEETQGDPLYEDEYDDEDAFDEPEETILYVYTDRQGNRKSEFRMPYRIDKIDGNLIECYNYSENELRLFDREGNPLTDWIYGYCHFDKTTGLFLAYDSIEGAVYTFDQSGNQTSAYSMDWDMLECGENGCVFLDRANNCAYRISDGTEIDFGRTDIALLDVVYGEAFEMSGDLSFVLQTPDGKCYLHDINGNEVAEIHAPDVEEKKDEDGAVSRTICLSANDKYILSASEKDGWYVYDRAAGNETRLPIPGMKLIYADGNDEYIYYSLYDRYLKISHSYMSDDLGEREWQELYDVRTGKLLCPNLIWFDYYMGIALVTAKNEAYAFDDDGNVILKLKNNIVI